jgi:Spy/CpxP family protein refolding chaperone
MKTKWMVWVAVIALAAMPPAVRAQERSEAVPPGEERHLPPGEADDIGEPDAMGGLGMLLMAAPPPGDAAHGPGPGSPRGRRADLYQQLNLTDDQKTKIADVRDRTERAAIPIRGNLEVGQLDLRKLMRAEKPDAKAIDAQIDKNAGLRASLQKARVAGMLEVRGLLTPAQQKTLRESGIGQRMGRGHRGPGRMRVGRMMRI